MNENIMQEVDVKGLAFDPVTNVPIVILKETAGKRVLPIWIGVFEANAIALEMENVDTPRPMTHDLFNNFFSAMDSHMVRVVVDNLMDNTFYASIYLESRGDELKLDSRPSDAIALALRAKGPIFVTDEVMSQAQSFDIDKDIGDKEDWKEWLERITPEDFSRYRS